MPLVYLPARCEFFVWGEACQVAPLAAAASRGEPAKIDLLIPGKRAAVAGMALPLLDTAASLAAVPAAAISSLPASIAVWSLASKLALGLVSRERVIPTVVRSPDRTFARWGAALADADDAAQMNALARSMPPSSHAVPVAGAGAHAVWAPEALLRAFLDATVDALVRSAEEGEKPPGRRAERRRGNGEAISASWEQRWVAALSAGDGAFQAEGFAERTLLDDLTAWSEPALGARGRARACFRLELPDSERDAFALRFLLQSPDDPSLLVTAAEVWNAKGRRLARLGRAFRDPQEALLEALGRAARLFPPIASSLVQPRPEAIALESSVAWQFLSEVAPTFAGAGFGVILPAELTVAGQRRLRLRMRVSGAGTVAGAVSGAAGLGLDQLLAFEWEAALGQEPLTLRELEALARHKAPLVRHRGRWIAVDPRELAEINRRLSQKTGRIGAREAIVAALAGEKRVDGTLVSVTAGGVFGDLLARLRDGAAQAADRPAGFRGTLRPYQSRGLAWLRTMGALGLGACLADDMGLGKTVQMLAFLLYRAQAAKDTRPALLVAPTSVLGNWEREAARFAPDLRVIRHYGVDRPRKPEDFPRASDTVVVTSYGLLRRDAALLASLQWSSVVLDEAQNIKNAASAAAKAARALPAAHRFALTGTPVENRLAELWSIFEFANPGLLGPLEAFRREFAVPVERYADDEAAGRLRRIASPFLLRRLKSDPAIIHDLPAKNEMKVFCPLTREQATLYRAVVDEEMRQIESVEGIERRGRVLALLMFLKQICNHPAQYLGEAGPMPMRSGKLERVADMLEEAVATGDKVLVFTQFREMGDRLLSYLPQRLGAEVAFLHGGTPRKTRDEMVRRFQDEPSGPPIFVLSLKAGGTGLNLTAASQVFHFDRWWNPAVEDQATDRVHRIGQKRSVQVYKLVCAGTVEEKVDQLLEAKRDLAAKVVGTGEKWITELGNEALRDLFSLSADAAIGTEDDFGDAAATGNGPRRRRGARIVEASA